MASARQPGLYRDILPAWSDPNLRSLCRQIRSGLFLAHVRASTGGATSRANCHPFTAGRWSFMHNGQIGEFEKLRRCLEGSLSDAAYEGIDGTTDSELFFALMLEEGLDSDPQGAAERATRRVIDAAKRAGATPSLRLTAAYSDGTALHAIRYATDAYAPTLYMADFRQSGGRCIVSEPLDREGPNWQAIPPSSFVTIAGGGVTILPFAPAATPRLAVAV